MRIIFTGGSGEAGRHVLPILLQAGHEILNLDLVPLPAPLNTQIHTLITDLTDAGQVYNALLSHSRVMQPFPGPPKPVDAVIHFASHARVMMVPDSEMWRTNVCGTFNVVDAACKLGIKKIIVASSICIYGTVYAEGSIAWDSVPVDEKTVCHPTDPYAIGKAACETLCEGYARKFGADIYALRIGHVVTAENFQAVFDGYLGTVERWGIHGWSYSDARDLAQLCERCLQTNGLGWQAFCAVNDEATNDQDIASLVERVYPNVEVKRTLEKGRSLIRNDKAKELLGFCPEHNWRKEYKAPN